MNIIIFMYNRKIMNEFNCIKINSHTVSYFKMFFILPQAFLYFMNFCFDNFVRFYKILLMFYWSKIKSCSLNLNTFMIKR